MENQYINLEYCYITLISKAIIFRICSQETIDFPDASGARVIRTLLEFTQAGHISFFTVKNKHLDVGGEAGAVPELCHLRPL